MDEFYKIVREQAEGCCGDDSWRGRFCQYHEGFYDGFVDGYNLAAQEMGYGARG